MQKPSALLGLGLQNLFPARGWKLIKVFGLFTGFVEVYKTPSPQGDGNIKRINVRRSDRPNAPIEYVGFLSTDELQKGCWVEAFKNVAIEALACGVPVIAYRRKGPAETVEDGKTGFLVEPDSVDGLVEAMGNLDKIDRYACRQRVEAEYSNQAMGDRMEQWLFNILNRAKRRLSLIGKNAAFYGVNKNVT